MRVESISDAALGRDKYWQISTSIKEMPIREQVILKLLTTMQISELHSLNYADIKADKRTIEIKVQNRFIRIVEIDEEAFQLIGKYVGETGTAEDRPLILNKENKRLGKRTIQKIIKKLREQAGIEKIKPVIQMLNAIPELQDFRQELKRTNSSKLTIRNYTYDILLFYRYLNNFDTHNFIVKPISAITRKDIRNFLFFCADSREYKGTSAKRKFAALQSYFKHCVKEEYIEKNPMQGLDPPKIEKTVPIFMTINEVERILAAAENILEEAILHVLLATGMRVSELSALNIDDVDFEGCVITILKGKGKNQRPVDVDPKTIRILRQYIEELRGVSSNPEDADALILNKNKPRMKVRTIQDIVRECRIKAGIKKPISPHKCRHTCGMLLLEGGADIRVIQKEFGHKQLTTTEIYTHVKDEFRTSTYKKAHPFMDE